MIGTSRKRCDAGLLTVAVVLSGSIWVSIRLAHATSTGPEPISIRIEAPSAYCTLTHNSAVLRRSKEQRILLECPAVDQVLHCDGIGIEPFDVAAEQACENSLRFRKAVDVGIEVDTPAVVKVEWLRIDQTGRRSVVATRTTTVSDRMTLSVAAEKERYVRFSRESASPITVPASELVNGPNWRLPESRPGGELFVLAESSAIAAESYRVSGPWDGEVYSRRGAIGVSGLHQGEYRIVPVYQGKLEGTPRVATVREGASTFLFLQRQDIGAAVIKAAPMQCASATELVVTRVMNPTTAPAHSATRQPVFQTTDIASCMWEIAGLPPGTYQAVLRVWGGLLGGARLFPILSQEVSDVVLPEPNVRVSGRVSANGKPLRGRSVRFDSANDGLESQVVTDEDGSYQSTLDQPGEYTVWLDGQNTATRLKTVTLSEGPNAVDWDLGSIGTITVQVKGAYSGASVDVNVVSSDSSRFASTRALPPSTDADLVWEGLPFGDYVVTAHSTGWSAEPKRVSISDHNDTATVELDLKETQSRLVLRDEDGSFIDTAHFRVFPGQLPRLLDHGIYSLDGIAPASWLRIQAPGVVPTCRRVPDDNLVDVVLRRGRSVVVDFASKRVSRLDYTFGSLLGLEGSDCPVPLMDFQSENLPAEDGHTRFKLLNFPTGDQFVLVRGPASQEITVRTDGLIFVR